LLAYQPLEALDRLLSRPLARFTPRTITNPLLLRRELEQVRAQGYAVAQEEYEVELSAAGAAVRDHRGDVVASITVSGPSFRLPAARLPELGSLVRQTADRISARLGHRPAGAAAMAGSKGARGAGNPPVGTARPPAPAAGQPGGREAAAPLVAPAVRSTPRRPPVGVAGPVFGS
jgi:hypothetical protein